jgi:hypothetical protein
VQSFGDYGAGFAVRVAGAAFGALFEEARWADAAVAGCVSRSVAPCAVKGRGTVACEAGRVAVFAGPNCDVLGWGAVVRIGNGFRQTGAVDKVGCVVALQTLCLVLAEGTAF